MTTLHFDTELFRKMLREYRGSRSQEDLAKEFGLGRSSVSLLENGKQLPTLDTLKKFCEKINKDISIFFRKEEDDPVFLLMGQLKDSDRDSLLEVLDRIKVREYYITISQRCGK
jgi:transcriptional regulator with XRE-family HTH domain